MLAQIINSTFEKVGGKFQAKKPESERKALVVKFSTNPDFDKEEGYRWLELALYASHNYVSVYVRKSWCVIPLEDLEDDGDGDTRIRKGADYSKGVEPWTRVCHHDSCWRDAVRNVLSDPNNKINLIDMNHLDDQFYTLIDPIEQGFDS